MNTLVILGASGHGKVIADIGLKNEYENILFLLCLRFEAGSLS